MNIYFYQLGLDKCPMITTLTKPELYLWIWKTAFEENNHKVWKYI